MKAVAENYMIQTVARALDLLELFQEDGAELGITDLSNRMNLQKNNVFRLVATLKVKKYLEINNSTGKYRLGIKTRELGRIATRQTDVTDLARPFLDDLKRQCHETCCFSVIKNGYSYFLDGVESDLPVRVSKQVGCSRPLYCTAAGRVQLAFMEPLKQLELLSVSEMKGLTARTITDSDLLRNELNRVAQQGYAIDDQEHDAGVIEIAAPVFDAQGTIIGALSISGPEMRLAGIRLTSELLPLVCQNAALLSTVLGYCRAEEVRSEISLKVATPRRRTKKTEVKPYALGGLKTRC